MRFALLLWEFSRVRFLKVFMGSGDRYRKLMIVCNEKLLEQMFGTSPCIASNDVKLLVR